MVPLEEITFELLGDVVLARLRGEVDLSNEASVKEKLLGSVPNSAAALVLDLSQTEYLDSSGVRLIFELAHRPEDSVINRLLVLTEIERVVPMFRSVDGLLQG